jgi:hypothetical protein
MLRQLTFTIEYPFTQYGPNSFVRNTFGTIDELKNAYNGIVKFYESVVSTCNLDETSGTESNETHDNVVDLRKKQLPYYLIQIRLVDEYKNVISQFSKMRDSYRRIRRVSNHHMYHVVTDNNRKLFFDDIDMQCTECNQHEDENENVSKSRYTSEFLDPYDLYLQRNEFQQIIDEINKCDATKPIELRVRVYDNETGKRVWGMDYDISAPVEQEPLYNCTIAVYRKNSKDVEYYKTVNSAYYELVKNTKRAVCNAGQYYIREDQRDRFMNHSCDPIRLNGVNFSEALGIIDNMDTVERFVVSCGSLCATYIRYEHRKNSTLSDSINERYVEDIEKQLSSFFTAGGPTTLSATCSTFPVHTVHASDADDVKTDEVLIAVPEQFSPRKSNRNLSSSPWIEKYNPVLFYRDNTLRVVPTTHHVPSIELSDRVLFDHNTSMSCPIYWNEREHAWISSILNRFYLESLFGDAVIIKSKPQAQPQLSLSVNEYGSNENVRLVVQENHNHPKSGSASSTNPRKRKTRSSNDERAIVVAEHVESVPANRDAFVPRRSTRLQMKTQ